MTDRKHIIPNQQELERSFDDVGSKHSSMVSSTNEGELCVMMWNSLRTLTREDYSMRTQTSSKKPRRFLHNHYFKLLILCSLPAVHHRLHGSPGGKAVPNAGCMLHRLLSPEIE